MTSPHEEHAYPFVELDAEGKPVAIETGMTLRQYAAIKLRVPNSGTDWLDEMIREARRDELAARAMQSYFQTQGGRTSEYALKWTAEKALEMADAMVKEMEADHG